jgi:hypothetical protein
MAQVLFKDKIPTLTEAGGTITMPAGARLTIGGQQYVTASALNVAANVSEANSRFQIFAVVNSGVVSLVISSNENSQGPTGHTIWKLVGSYYTNGVNPVGFGSFINITGVPRTDIWNAGVTIVVDTGNGETGTVSTNPINDFWFVQREGKNLRYNWTYSTNSTTGTSPGVTTLYLFWPRSFSTIHSTIREDIHISTAFSPLTTTFGRQATAHAFLTIDNVGYDESTYAYYPRPFGVGIVESDNVLDSAKFPLNSFTTNYGIKVRDVVPIENWDETPIEDL